MKKLLFATSALVATAGVAQADMSLTGEAKFGLRGPAAATNDDVHLNGTIDFNIVGAGSTDNGLIFGASLDVDAGTANPTDATGSVSDLEVFISGGFGTLTVGNLAHAADAIGLDDVGFDGVGVDDDVETLRNGAGANVAYSHSVGGFGITLTAGLDYSASPSGLDGKGNPARCAPPNTPRTVPDNVERDNDICTLEGDFGVGLSYTVDGFTAKVAYDKDKSADATSTALEVDYKAGDFDVGVTWINGENNNGYGIDAGYSIDALSLGFAYGATNDDTDEADYGIGFSYALGGGLSLHGGVASVDDEAGWDLGIKMAF